MGANIERWPQIDDRCFFDDSAPISHRCFKAVVRVCNHALRECVLLVDHLSVGLLKCMAALTLRLP